MFSSDVSPENAVDDIELRFLPIDTFFKLTQFSNALLSIDFKFSPRVSVSKFRQL